MPINTFSQGDVNKIDSLAVNGLEGVSNSLAYKVEEIERHFHGYEKWFGVAAAPAGETNIADRMAGGIASFQLVAGADTWGNWVQILGSSDTPVLAGNAKFDLHRIMVTTTNSTNPYIIQVVSGESAGIAASLTAETFTEFGYISASNNNDSGIVDIMEHRKNVGTKMWARTCCIGGNATTINFYIGLHEYEG